MKAYLQPLIDDFSSRANPQKAKWMFDYMKGQYEFFGLESKVRREAEKNFYKQYGQPKQEHLFDLIDLMWSLPQREFQHGAIDLLRKNTKTLQKQDIKHIENYITAKSWWDTIDGIAVWVCGAYFKLFPEQIESITSKWMDSGNFWLQRSCLLFQLKYKEATNTELLKSFIEPLHTEKEFFIRKAIGWALREYSKTNPIWVSQYVSQQKLSGLSYREATKYI